MNTAIFWTARKVRWLANGHLTFKNNAALKAAKAKRYPWIVEAARKNRVKQFIIDGEAVVLGVDGVSDFDAQHSGKCNDEVQLYAFDIMALDGEDLRGLPLSMRKTNLARLLARRPDGIFVAPFERGEIGPDLFRAGCRMGLEGLVSKRRMRKLAGRLDTTTGWVARNGASAKWQRSSHQD
ncbi:hypothetical protein Q2941_16530 [Bradyrhizobium sp. UFLA05-153]